MIQCLGCLFFKQKTAYEMRISDWSSDVCSSDLEDDEDVRFQAASILSDLGYGILEAENGAAALKMLRARPDIALLFTDIAMPGNLNGLELAVGTRRFRAEERRVGEEYVRTGRARVSPSDENNTTEISTGE